MILSRHLILAVLLAAICTLSAAGVALAGPPGSWTQLTGPHTNTAEAGVARTADGTLHVLFPLESTGSYSANHTSLSPDAKTVGGTNPVFTYPAAINPGMDLVAGPSGLRAFFSGLFDTTSNPLYGLMATASSADGAAWAVQPTAASNDSPSGKSTVYAASGIGAALGTDGTPYSTWGDSAPVEAGYHVGLSSAGADNRFSTSCCVYDPDIGVDSVTGEVVLAWKFLQASNGVAYQSISPAGAAITPPEGNAANTGTRTPISGRIGAPGVYLGYLAGTNQFTSTPAIIRTGTTSALKFPRASGAQYLGIAPAPGGRMWMFWSRQNKITATRSNPDVTVFGAPVNVKRPSGGSAVYGLAGEGSTGPLDLLALTETPGGIHNWHQRILPGLTLAYKSGKGKIKFKVTDAGTPVKGAKVKAGGKTKKTAANGRVTIKLKKGKYKSKATKTGYAPGSVTAKSK